MRNIKVVVEYDGTDYVGFQRHPGRRTIQGELERALTRITKQPVVISGAGRTDAGVHAVGQVISFVTGGTIPVDRVPYALNCVLPRAIVARDASEMPPEFHARYSAKSRRYRYAILNCEKPRALVGRYSWHVPGEIDVNSMRFGGECLIGKHDFTSFSASMATPSRVREIASLGICRDGESITVEIEANAFLHSMARIIVGTLVEVGQGRRKPEDIQGILDGTDRRMAGMTAPPQGLVLMEVTY